MKLWLVSFFGGSQKLLLRSDDAFELRLKLLIGPLEELNFFRVLLFLHGSLFSRSFLNLFAFRLQLVHLSLEILLLFLQLFDFRLHVRLSLFGLKRFSHAEGDAGFVERLIGGDRHANLVSYTQKKKPAFRAVDCHLSDQFVEALRVQFSPDWTDSGFPRLSLLQPHVQLLLKIDDVQSSRWSR